MQMLASFSIRKAEATSGSADIELSMYDPFNYYAVGEVWMWESEGELQSRAVLDFDELLNREETDEDFRIMRMSANQTDNHIKFGELKPDTTYSIVFGYYDETGKFSMGDYTSVHTQPLDTWVRVSSVNMQSILLEVKLDNEEDEIPQEAYVYIIGHEDEEGYTGSIPPGESVGERYEITDRIKEMRSSRGATISSITTEKFIPSSEDEIDVMTPYVTVLVAATYENSKVQEVGRQVVRNPYYGMGVYYDKGEDEGEPGIRFTKTEKQMKAMAEKAYQEGRQAGIDEMEEEIADTKRWAAAQVAAAHEEAEAIKKESSQTSGNSANAPSSDNTQNSSAKVPSGGGQTSDSGESQPSREPSGSGGNTGDSQNSEDRAEDDSHASSDDQSGDSHLSSSQTSADSQTSSSWQTVTDDGQKAAEKKSKEEQPESTETETIGTDKAEE